MIDSPILLAFFSLGLTMKMITKWAICVFLGRFGVRSFSTDGTCTDFWDLEAVLICVPGLSRRYIPTIFISFPFFQQCFFHHVVKP